ncbi:uncharacterized protein LOC123672905 [Harmonia axyridis]|uniref:uncharacterized protein LOC123672905 n=1 Tax=Harmonia axyridis TaxID=115357 RepID=UPI001E2783F4|nr:uncharacterized protein LOC123672905 [Harmonia axyridis]
MVKRRFHKKNSQTSSDESDSDDFYEEESMSEAQPKKYSLRQRKEANFAKDFDYDIVEDYDTNVVSGSEVLRSDDDDFGLNNGTKKKSALDNKSKTSSKSLKAVDNGGISNCIITKCKDRELEPEIPKDKQSSADMIDFEDVIRADVLVNKSRIDYDTIIEKTEIKIEKKESEEVSNISKKEKTFKLKANGEPAKKRGRKPKKKLEVLQTPTYKKRKFEENVYETFTNETTGLPINSVLGMTESLYELAERYHLQGGIMVDEMEPLPLEPILNENVSETSKNVYLGGNNEVPLQQSDAAASEAIETF